MGFKIKIIMHSVSPKGKELVTYKLRFPCEILAEVNTHTILSKSAQSMRAVPYPEVRRMILEDPWIPPFGTRKAGMVAGEELRGQEAETARRIWLDQRGAAIKAADQLSEMRTAKQVVNRLIQPWAWTNQVLTGTDWPNFFAQRTDTNAHPAFQRLSRAMWVAYSRSVPVRLDYNEWHAPFVGHGSQQQLLDKMLAAGTIDQAGIDLYRDAAISQLQIPLIRSVVCCARTSYEVWGERDRTAAEDLKTWGTLFGQKIKHPSPAQHQGTPLHPAHAAQKAHLRSNLDGWIQYRKLIPGEKITEFAPTAEDVASWNVNEEDLV